MFLSKIILNNFRNFEKKEINLNNSLTLIFGRNSSGKTNLLESINFLLTGEGFRNFKEDELIKFNNNYVIVEGFLVDKNNQYSLKINIKKNDNFFEKNFFVNNIKKTKNQYLKESIPLVLFSPEQLEIITGSPKIRRQYFDLILSKVDPIYKLKLNNYHQALKKRNKLLEFNQNINKLKEELYFWNQYLIENGSYLIKKRKEYVEYLNLKNLEDKNFKVKYFANNISLEIFEKNFNKELQAKKTLYGPQKDDFIIYLEEKNIDLYGSRSEEKLALLWLKLNELSYFENIFKKKPLLLLDDVFSELDDFNKIFIFSLLKNYQVVATYTNKEIIKLINFSNNSFNHSINL